MDIIQELEHVAHLSREEGRIPDAERLEAVINVLRAILQNAEPVAWLGTKLNCENRLGYCDAEVRKEFEAVGWTFQPLFTHPPKDSTEPIDKNMKKQKLLELLNSLIAEESTEEGEESLDQTMQDLGLASKDSVKRDAEQAFMAYAKSVWPDQPNWWADDHRKTFMAGRDSINE